MPDRPSRPHRSREQIAQATVIRIEGQIRQRWIGAQFTAEFGARWLPSVEYWSLPSWRALCTRTHAVLNHLEKPGGIDSVGHCMIGEGNGRTRDEGFGWEFIRFRINNA